MHRLVSVGKHRLRPLELGKDGTVPLPWASGEDGALLEFDDSKGTVIVTALSEEAHLIITKRGAAPETLELGLSLEMEVGSKLELRSENNAEASFVYLVTALKKQTLQPTSAGIATTVACSVPPQTTVFDSLITPAPTLAFLGPSPLSGGTLKKKEPLRHITSDNIPAKPDVDAQTTEPNTLSDRTDPQLAPTATPSARPKPQGDCEVQRRESRTVAVPETQVQIFEAVQDLDDPEHPDVGVAAEAVQGDPLSEARKDSIAAYGANQHIGNEVHNDNSRECGNEDREGGAGDPSSRLVPETQPIDILMGDDADVVEAPRADSVALPAQAAQIANDVHEEISKDGRDDTAVMEEEVPAAEQNEDMKRDAVLTHPAQVEAHAGPIKDGSNPDANADGDSEMFGEPSGTEVPTTFHNDTAMQPVLQQEDVATEEALADVVDDTHADAGAPTEHEPVDCLARTAPTPAHGGLAAAAASSDCIVSLLRDGSALIDDVRATLIEQPERPLSTAARTVAWTADLDRLRARCAAPQVLIGVVGDTGAGKSSMLNALLGEEDVLPVNGMRACTASVVEVSYGASSVYAAEVEFMAEAEWKAQVESFWNDLHNEDGVPQIQRDPRRYPDARTLAGAAQTQLESVLGRTIVRSQSVTLEKLLRAKNQATSHLGRTIKVREFNAKAFRKTIGRYVDSQNKRDETSTWPLVRCTRVSHNWPLLESGAVLVDLPGVRDANAARGRIAEGYLKRCNAIWVVADITRAVDNKTAKDLLGDSFRRQMVMDGQFGAISFVCTKSDNLSSREIVSTLGVEEIAARAGLPLEEFLSLEEELEAAQNVESEMDSEHRSALRQEKRVLRKIGRLDGLLQAARDREDDINSGGGSSAPGNDGLGRFDKDVYPHHDDDDEEEEEAGFESDASELDDDDGGNDGDGSSSSAEEDDEEEGEGEEINLQRVREQAFSHGKASGRRKMRNWDDVEMVREEIARIKESLASHREELSVLQDESRKARSRLDGAQRASAKFQLSMNAVCGKARNSYAREQLRRDFKEGIEAVEEAASDRVETTRENLRVTSSTEEADLPVYCISARDAQRLEGRFRRDGKPSAFSRLEHTEVPSLRDHVRQLAKKGRLHSARTATAALSSFIISAGMSLFDMEGGSTADTTATATNQVQSTFSQHTKRIQEAVRTVVDQWAGQLERLLLEEGLAPRLGAGAARAEAAAMATQAKWAAPPRQGGYYWGTYKAAVRPHRLGEYASASRAGEVNMNGALAGPMLDAISVAFDNTFSVQVAQHLRQLSASILGVLRATLCQLSAALQEHGLDGERLARLCEATLTDEHRRINDVLEALSARVGEAQRDLSRDVIAPDIKQKMTPAYNACSAETGKGQFMRMKAIMADHVDKNKQRMFVDAAGKMEAQLRRLACSLRATAHKLAATAVQRLPSHFSVLWEKPQSDPVERAHAVVKLAKFAGEATALCHRSGAIAADLHGLEVAAKAARELLQQVEDQRRGSIASQMMRCAQDEQGGEEEKDEEEAEEHDDDVAPDGDEEEVQPQNNGHDENRADHGGRMQGDGVVDDGGDAAEICGSKRTYSKQQRREHGENVQNERPASADAEEKDEREQREKRQKRMEVMMGETQRADEVMEGSSYEPAVERASQRKELLITSYFAKHGEPISAKASPHRVVIKKEPGVPLNKETIEVISLVSDDEDA